MKKQKYLKQEKGIVFFLMNVLSLGMYNGHYYWFCDKYYKKKCANEKNCPICQIPIIFCDFEKDLPNNIFNEKFLWEYHNKLNFHLQEIFMIDKSALCCF